MTASQPAESGQL
uniref:Uncharacterized protein n=13 Tax=Bacteria TaxID=2 RepID=Q799T7_ECOLX|nr:Urf-2X protein [Acinetobacter calcoaceticus]AAD34400.1 Urf2X [mercury resistant bacterium '96 SE13]CAA54979.1 URF-2X [Yersinia enterocolitica]CAA70180.1 URF-2X protein [Pantoea agglomerans]CAA70193.1 URF-2X protein [Alcaligenes sp.]CAA70234.1 unnamed protein product [Enterobacter cloacae]CAA71186.1 unnamed protein product [Escherichia coli]CAC80895.1 Urf-2X protein [Acinetobacter sp. ED23-35]CAD31050.1 Urf-2X protein [Acinetobacter sp. ED45-25]CAD31072.1 Urf-2X protein [Acinetobacter sp